MPNKYELRETSLTSESQHSESVQHSRASGMYISTAKAFILLAFLAIAIAVGVGIAVYFAANAQTLECSCSFPETGNGNGNQTALEQCASWAGEGNQQICDECPAGETGTPSPPSTTAGSTTPGPPTTTPRPQIDVRLPLDIEPLLYTIELQPRMYEGPPSDFTFTGSMTLLVHCKVATDRITLHINKINITGPITLTQENGVTELYKEHTFDTERQFLIVHAKETLMPGSNYTLDVASFAGPLAPDNAGLYLVSYKRGNDTIYIATSQMQPTDARKTFPCMDEPAMKAEFDVTLVRKSHMKSLSNMPIIMNETRADGWIADKFQKTVKMSTYLLAFIVCDFEYVEKTTETNVLYRSWSRPEALSQTHFSLETGVQIGTYFEDYFNIPYPLPKQDMIAIPYFPYDAMENWGLITYHEYAMLYEPGVSSEGNKQFVAQVVSHELSHQWFGNLVTPSWWDDLWLNEGFATYFEYLGVDHLYPDWKMIEQFVSYHVHYVFHVDSIVSSHPVYVPVSHPDEINEIFDSISYSKGASIIRMMKFFLGDNTFRRGVTNYLTKHVYGAVFHDDLWYALGNQSIADGNRITNVKEVMDTWTLQMNFPIIMVGYTQAGHIRITQSRYLRDLTVTDPGKFVSPFDYKWEVPFTYTTNMNPQFDLTNDDVIMMNKTGDPVDIISAANIAAPEGNNWIIGNIMQYGYYRVNYDERNWYALINQLNTDHTVIDPINRAQIINDAWNLATSGHLPMEIALRTSEYLSKEREIVPREAASLELNIVGVFLTRHPLYGAFSHFMQNITRNMFDEIGMNNTGAKHIQSLQRSGVVNSACLYGMQACVDEAKQLYADWMKTPANNPIDPGIKWIVYCTAVKMGGLEEWEFALGQFMQATVAGEYYRLLQALACSNKIWILSKYLEMSLDSNIIYIHDMVYVIVTVSRNRIGRSLAWDFFRANWNFYFTKFNPYKYTFGYLIRAITARFDTQIQLGELKRFIDSRDDLGSGARAFDQALEKTQSNIRWMDANVPIIEKWLTDQGF